MKRKGRDAQCARDLKTFLEGRSLVDGAKDTTAHSLECVYKRGKLTDTSPRRIDGDNEIQTPFMQNNTWRVLLSRNGINCLRKTTVVSVSVGAFFTLTHKGDQLTGCSS